MSLELSVNVMWNLSDGDKITKIKTNNDEFMMLILLMMSFNDEIQ